MRLGDISAVDQYDLSTRGKTDIWNQVCVRFDLRADHQYRTENQSALYCKPTPSLSLLLNPLTSKAVVAQGKVLQLDQLAKLSRNAP